MAPNDWNASRDDVMQSLGRIEARLEQSLKLHDEAHENGKELTQRVSDLEKSRAWVLGAAAAVSTIIGYLSQHFPNLGK